MHGCSSEVCSKPYWSSPPRRRQNSALQLSLCKSKPRTVCVKAGRHWQGKFACAWATISTIWVQTCCSCYKHACDSTILGATKILNLDSCLGLLSWLLLIISPSHSFSFSRFQERNVPDSAEKLQQSLQWLGIQFDESPELGGKFGPYIQVNDTTSRWGRCTCVASFPGLCTQEPGNEASNCEQEDAVYCYTG